MLYLIMAILLNVVLSALFKLFPKYKVDAFQAIVFNYGVCVVTGSLFLGRLPYTATALHAPWLPWAVMMGGGFIAVFNLFAYSTKVDGITTATIANKLSLVIPVVVTIVVSHEHAGWMKILGILLAFPSVYLTTKTKDEQGKQPQLIWPLLLFVGSGMLDTLVNFVQSTMLQSTEDQATYTVFCFSTAGFIGVCILAYKVATGAAHVHVRNILAGIILGIPNYFSIYFLIRALNSKVMESSAAIPVMNIGVLVASSLTAIIVFKEHADKQRIIGLVLSVIAILLIAFGGMQ